MHRRAFCKALAAAPVLATPALLRSAFADEVSSIVLVSQHGLPYLPLMVMDTLKLIEKHAGKARHDVAQAGIQDLGRHAVADRRAFERANEFRRHRRAGPCDALGQDRRHGKRGAGALGGAVDAVHAGDQPRDQDDQGFHRQGQDRDTGGEGVEPGDLPADGGGEGVGQDQYARLDPFTITRLASGGRHVGDLEGNRN